MFFNCFEKVFQNSRELTFSRHPEAEGSLLLKNDKNRDSSHGCRISALIFKAVLLLWKIEDK